MKKILFFIILINATTLFSQTKSFSGIWTKINTTYTFEFDLVLDLKADNKVEGYFIWKVIQYDEKNQLSKNHYQNKIGKTAKEYIRGTYSPTNRKYHLKGYKKEDPDRIIGIDTYDIIEDKTGNIKGNTNANGSWLGRIRGRLNEIDLL